MAKYIMAIKGKGAELNSVIWNTDAPNIREAKDYFVRLKQLPEKEFDRLWIHGLAHLLGYDHKKDSDFNKMRKVEKKFFSFIN